MLVLDRREGTFPDDADPGLRYRLPAGLVPLPGPDGTPQAMVTRSSDGGQLLLRLGGSWELQDGERPVAFTGGRFRLRLRAPSGAAELGGWRETAIAGETLVDRSVALDPVETAIALRLGRHAEDLVEVEVQLDVHGLTVPLPWLLRTEADALRPRLAALLGPEPTSWEEVENAFLGLTPDTFTWYPLEPAALRPAADQAMKAIAHLAAPLLLLSGERGWSLADDWPATIDVSLAVPQVRRDAVALSWSFSDFLAAASDPARHLIDVSVPAPFEAADVHVVNDVPLAAGGISSIVVEVATGGPTGTVRHEFLPGAPGAARLRFVLETFEELALRWRAHATVSTAQGPTVVSTDFRATGMLVEVTSDSLHLAPLLLHALPEVFEHLDGIEITLGSRTLTLRATAPQAWAVGRTPPPTAPVVALLPSGERRPLGDLPLARRGLTLDAAALGVGESVDVVLRPPADLAGRAAYLAVQVEGGPWRTLDAGEQLACPVRRDNRLVPARLRYRCKVVARDDGGGTRPMSESAWIDAEGELIEMEV